MRPCRATRAGTQAPPLPISIIFFHAIPHKQHNHLRVIHPNETNRPIRNLPKRHQPPICNPPLPISTKPCGVPIPHRGYTFDSAGLASATQPTLGNNASEEATPLGVVLFPTHCFLISSHTHNTSGAEMHRALPPPLLKIKKCVYVMISAPP